jgi:hypothetical protein
LRSGSSPFKYDLVSITVITSITIVTIITIGSRTLSKVARLTVVWCVQGELKQAKDEADRLRAERNKLHIAQREHEAKNAWGAAQELVTQLTARNSLLQRQWQRVLALQSEDSTRDWKETWTSQWAFMVACL